jgi:hypothetical protein
VCWWWSQAGFSSKETKSMIRHLVEHKHPPLEVCITILVKLLMRFELQNTLSGARYPIDLIDIELCRYLVSSVVFLDWK